HKSSPEDEEAGGIENDVAAEDDYSGEEDDSEDSMPVTLGFVEKAEKPWLLLRQYFPSKAGGAPAWLNPLDLPSGKSSLCDFCGKPLQFLLQVYAPLSSESAFHRTVFIFMCPSMACLLRDQHEQWKRYPEIPLRSVKVFRCQLPRVNPFYSEEGPDENGTQEPMTPGATLCKWCGTWKGDKICSGCRTARYCSSIHQTAHWRSHKSSHKVLCRQKPETSSARESESAAASNTLWPEYALAIDEEPELEQPSNPDGSLVLSDLKSHVDESMEMMKMQRNNGSKSWASFQERVSLAPDQVLRYCSSQAKPLWPGSGGQPSKYDIPNCSHCGGPRRFEFQVLPQLLYFFHVEEDDAADWSTIAVYTCQSSCEVGPTLGYKEEFGWVQLDSSSLSY
ncbi:hypothetical protein M569_15516, partial [Genlisea aurea]